MVSAVEAARKAARQALERTYDGVASVVEYKKIKDEETRITNFKEVSVLEGQPCRLSFSSITTVVQSDSTASVNQTTKLFISPDVAIKPGSKITVTQNEVTKDYTYSGVPAVYATHQEIMLELFRGWT